MSCTTDCECRTEGVDIDPGRNACRSVTEKALAAVLGPRREDYGPPSINHTRTAALWSAYLGIPIEPWQVCWLNVLQKIAREQNAPTEDGLVDVVGYALNLAEMRADG